MVAQYGTTGKDGNSKFFINFKDGTRIEYGEQKPGTRVDRYDYAAPGFNGNYGIFGLKNATITSSKESDTYSLHGCQFVKLDTYDNDPSASAKTRDTIFIREDCENIYVRGDENDFVEDNGTNSIILDWVKKI